MMIAEKENYPGRCLLCNQVLDKAEMAEHIKDCVASQPESNGKTVKVFHIQVEGRHLPMYWLHLECPGAMTLADLDDFLREIWLECCGHLSCFTIEGVRYSCHPGEKTMFMPREESMNKKLYKILSSDTEFQHEYDYGSTTELQLQVVECTKRQVESQRISLMARNEAPAWVCADCGKPATKIEATGWGLDVASLFCDDCAGDDEEGFLPLVNSPRTGVCGYC